MLVNHSPARISPPVSGSWMPESFRFWKGVVQQASRHATVAGRVFDPSPGSRKNLSVRLNMALPVALVGKATYKPRCPKRRCRFQMCEKGRFGLALAHRRFHQQDAGSFKSASASATACCNGRGAKPKHLIEGFRFRGKRGSGFPSDCVQGLLGFGSALLEPSLQIIAVLWGSKGEPVFVGADPVGKTRKPRQQHEFSAG